MYTNKNSNIDVTGLDKAEVLAALYNASRPLVMGFFQYDSKPMTKEEARKLLDRNKGQEYFDYLKGRLMKLDLTGNVIDVGLYDRDNEPGTAAMAIDELRKKKDVNTDNIKLMHAEGVIEAAKSMDMIPRETKIEESRHMVVMTLGLGDELREALRPKVEKAVAEARETLKLRQK